MTGLLAVALVGCSALFAVDGDTIDCDGLRMRLLGNGEPYVSGVDTPEIGGAKCKAERALGQKARLRLAELLNTPGLTIEQSGASDKYGRDLVRLRLPDDREAGQMLIDEGLAVVWRPGRRADWCG